ncbi:MAG TPA: methyltransferase domain-containing protein [Thermoplasmata archaeon]
MDARTGVVDMQSSMRADLDRQLQRQSIWLRDSWFWLLETKVLGDYTGAARRPTALDVGCGPGMVIELLEGLLDLQGIDIDPGMVDACLSKKLRVRNAAAEELPFEDDSFDIVYCSFLLLWVKDPVKVVSEMRRVSKRWVICMAEPDFGARIDYPEEVSTLRELIIDGIRRDGGDPLIGRKLRSVYSQCGLESDIGIHPGIWSIDKLKEESADEWRYIEMTVAPGRKGEELAEAKRAWYDALEKGSLFQFNPIFYAFGKKPHIEE